jgi:LPS sulfotransferase NodH
MFTECKIEPRPFYYEDIQENPLSALRCIAEDLGVNAPMELPPPDLTVLRDRTSASWRDRLMADLPKDLADFVAARAAPSI